jgi:hypothetical protein
MATSARMASSLRDALKKAYRTGASKDLARVRMLKNAGASPYYGGVSYDGESTITTDIVSKGELSLEFLTYGGCNFEVFDVIVQAAMDGGINFVKLALEDVEEDLSMEFAVLCAAVVGGHVATVQWLLSRKQTAYSIQLAYMYAARCNNITIMNMLNDVVV